MPNSADEGRLRRRRVAGPRWIADWLADHYPSVAPTVARRIRHVIAHIGRWPESARRSAKRPDVRVTTVGRYPYKIFYRIMPDAVQILHVHHAARKPWDEKRSPD